MLKISKIIQPGSLTGAQMAKDMVDAIGMSVDESIRNDFKVMLEGRLQYIAQIIFDYNKSHSGGSGLVALNDTRQQLETIADEMAEDINVANMLPATAEEIPADRATLMGLLDIANKYPTYFDTSLINHLEDAMAQTEDVTPIQQEMVASGMFSAQQRMDMFIAKTKSTMERYEEMARMDVGQKTVEQEMREQKKGDKANAAEEEQKRLRELGLEPETKIENLTPEMRAEVEERQAEQAAAQLREEEKARAQGESRTEFYKGTMSPTGEIPGLDQFMKDLQVMAHSYFPGDEEMRATLIAYTGALMDAAAKDPDNWQQIAKEMFNSYPMLESLASEMQQKIDSQTYEREQKIRAPHRPPQETTPESQKIEELPADVSVTPEAPIAPTSAIIVKNQEFDAMKGQGPWELDLEAKAIRRRKVMVANAIMGRPPVPFTINDTVGFSRGSAIDSGKIVAIKAHSYIVENAAKNRTEVDHEAVFETSATDLF
jgi:hypothetical protein